MDSYADIRSPEMKGMDICITKFTSIDLLYYPRLVRLLGTSALLEIMEL
jgi:hypothetical protein